MAFAPPNNAFRQNLREANPLGFWQNLQANKEVFAEETITIQKNQTFEKLYTRPENSESSTKYQIDLPAYEQVGNISPQVPSILIATTPQYIYIVAQHGSSDLSWRARANLVDFKKQVLPSDLSVAFRNALWPQQNPGYFQHAWMVQPPEKGRWEPDENAPGGQRYVSMQGEIAENNIMKTLKDYRIPITINSYNPKIRQRIIFESGVMHRDPLKRVWPKILEIQQPGPNGEFALAKPQTQPPVQVPTFSSEAMSKYNASSLNSSFSSHNYATYTCVRHDLPINGTGTILVQLFEPSLLSSQFAPANSVAILVSHDAVFTIMGYGGLSNICEQLNSNFEIGRQSFYGDNTTSGWQLLSRFQTAALNPGAWQLYIVAPTTPQYEAGRLAPLTYYFNSFWAGNIRQTAKEWISIDQGKVSNLKIKVDPSLGAGLAMPERRALLSKPWSAPDGVWDLTLPRPI